MHQFSRDLQNMNQLMSIYSTNGIFSPIQYDPNLIGLPIPLEPVSHGNCSCATSSSCIELVVYNNQIVPGFNVGCLLLETLFQSTLVCLYNQTCMDQININYLPVGLLNARSNHGFSINRSVELLIDNFLDQQRVVSIDCAKFFTECQPANCFYSTSHR